MHPRPAGDPPASGGHAGVVSPLRHDHPTGGRAPLQELPGGQRAPAAARRLRLRRAPRVRLGLPGFFPALAVQLLAGEMHKVFGVRSVFLAQQIHLPLAPAQLHRQVRPARRRQLQLVAAAHEAERQPPRGGDSRVGGRQGDVQRRHAEAPPGQLHGAGPQAGQSRSPAATRRPLTQNTQLPGHRLAHLEGGHGLHLPQAAGVLVVLYLSMAEEELHLVPPRKPIFSHRKNLSVRFQTCSTRQREDGPAERGGKRRRSGY